MNRTYNGFRTLDNNIINNLKENNMIFNTIK